MKTGTATITIKSKEGGAYSWTVTVEEPYLGMTIKLSNLVVGTKYTFDAEAFGYKEGTITWTSSNTKAGTINAKTGEFTAKKAGTTTITATDSAGYSVQNKVTVKKSDNSDIAKYIILHSNPEAGEEMESLIYNHLINIYKSVYQTFGDGTYHYIDVYFEHINRGNVAAYATLNGTDHNELHIGIETMQSNMNDIDVATHELIHTAQNYSFSTKTGEDRTWLGEGLTDYGRYLLGINNEKAGWSLPEYNPSMNYTDSYTITGAFIKYVVDNYDSAFAMKLNQAFRDGQYTEELWKKCTGYTIDQLWENYANQ